MAVAWTPHRFSGGCLALDAANTVVHRDKPEKRFDRFAEAEEIARFAEAASRHRADEWAGRRLHVADPGRAGARVVALREATDHLFRRASAEGRVPADALPDFLRRTADSLEAAPATDGGGPLPFETAQALSALALLGEERWRRIRICPNCAWLFLDKSRNRSRLWCDMAVCGNRAKARRHRSRLVQGDPSP